MIPTFKNPVSLQTSETDSNVLGVENLSSSSEVIVRFILREVVLPKNTFKDRINPSVTKVFVPTSDTKGGLGRSPQVSHDSLDLEA